ncbi:MAG: DUF2892 domain-containing protein [Trueperaceae bacterium]|jgi:hypothetical protein|nr:MAG: DUF2892 domain-containing protein [Trueperaceae bacterium]
MTVNEGTLDRSLRAIVGVVLVAAWLLGWLTGTLAIVLGIVGVVLLLTAAVGFCPLYRVLGMNTCAVPRR